MANGKLFNYRNLDDCERLPDSYGVTNVTLITRDPHWIYAYWDISSESFSKANQALGKSGSDAILTLRLHDVTLIDFNGSNANHSFDVEVDPNTNNRYINLWSDNVSYCAELGLKTQSGAFYSFTRSNTVSTQRRDWANKFDANWGEVRHNKNGSFDLLELKPKAQRTDAIEDIDEQQSGKFKKASKEELEAHHSWQELPDKLIERTHEAKKRRQPLSADEILAYYARLFPRLRKAKPQLIARLKRKGLWKDELDNDAELSGQNQFKGISPFSKEIFFKRPKFGASEEFEEKGGASEMIGGASESLLNAGGGSELIYRSRKFFFELYAEVIVYGRTEPDATVWWGKEKITLRQDGTFSMRFALPDRRIPLDFTAVSNDNIEQRSILTAVERFKTTYRNEIRPV